MNLLLFRPEEIVNEQRALIEGPRAFHLLKTLKVKVGDSLRAGFVNGASGAARVLEVAPGRVLLEHDLDPEAPSTDPEPLFDVLLAMPRPRVLERLLRDLATLGAGRILVTRSWRVEKSYLGADILNAEQTEEALLQGLEQGRGTRLPEVQVATLFRPFVEDRLDAWAPSRRFVAHPGAEFGVGDIALEASERFMLAIGPEGGFIPFEIELLQSRGFVGIDLGPRIQRVESALLYTLGALEQRRA